jgi:hypothetical protein
VQEEEEEEGSFSLGSESKISFHIQQKPFFSINNHPKTKVEG